MLKINDMEYPNSIIETSFDEYFCSSKGKNRKGLALYVCFQTQEYILCLETNYDKKWLEDQKINLKNNISEFILDIAIRKNNLEDSYNLLDENIEGFITRLDKKNYKLELKCIGIDEESHYNILIDENLKLF